MKIRTDISAGYTSLEQCQADTLYWKNMAYTMEVFARTGVWNGTPKPPTQPPTQPPTYPTYPSYPTGGYVGGVWYPDYSGACG